LILETYKSGNTHVGAGALACPAEQSSAAFYTIFTPTKNNPEAYSFGARGRERKREEERENERRASEKTRNEIL
jgi:hypothetical protein